MQAIGTGLSCVTGEYESLLADPVLHLLSRMVADRSASTRKELVFMSKNLLVKRIRTFGRRAIEDALTLTYENHQNNIQKYGEKDSESNKWSISTGGNVSTRTGELDESSVSGDLQLVALLLLLQGDESEEVISTAREVIIPYS